MGVYSRNDLENLQRRPPGPEISSRRGFSLLAQFLDVDLSWLSLSTRGSQVIHISRDPLYPSCLSPWPTTTLLRLLGVCRCKLGRDIPLSALSAFSCAFPGYLRGCQSLKPTQWLTPL